MKIQYVSQYFPPEMGAPAARVSELAYHWVQAGHQVTVLTGFPNHPTGVVPLEYRAKLRKLVSREQINGINVVRTWLMPLPNRKPLERILSYTSFQLSSSLTGTFLHRPEVIIATSPQPLVGLTGWWLSRIKRVPFVLEIRDLWPDSLTGCGVGGEKSLMFRALGALSKFLYRSCDHIVVVTPAFKKELVTKWRISPEKISVVENGVQTDLFCPDGSTAAYKKNLGLDGQFVVSYIGTLGQAHGLSTALKSAAELQTAFPNIFFLFVGEGADKEHLLNQAKSCKLHNVRFLPGKPREEIPSVIKASDICLVLLKKADVFKTVIPTKMLEFMACGRPLILGVDGQAREIVEQAQAGIFVEPENSAALTRAITRLYGDSELRETLGKNGRHYIVNHFSRHKTAQVYIDVLHKNVVRNSTQRAKSPIELAIKNTDYASKSGQ
jgi:colanic acid biosynthesis glycosyl transferase WcaI